jgi:hypothetical protein
VNLVALLKEKLWFLELAIRRRRALSSVGGLSGPVAIALTVAIIAAGAIIIYFILTAGPSPTTTYP